jgi:hypothetical protein
MLLECTQTELPHANEAVAKDRQQSTQEVPDTLSLLLWDEYDLASSPWLRVVCGTSTGCKRRNNSQLNMRATVTMCEPSLELQFHQYLTIFTLRKIVIAYDAPKSLEEVRLISIWFIINCLCSIPDCEYDGTTKRDSLRRYH